MKLHVQSHETLENLYGTVINLHKVIENRSQDIALVTLSLCKVNYQDGSLKDEDETEGTKITMEIRAELAIEGPFALNTNASCA